MVRTFPFTASARPRSGKQAGDFRHDGAPHGASLFQQPNFLIKKLNDFVQSGRLFINFSIDAHLCFTLVYGRKTLVLSWRFQKESIMIKKPLVVLCAVPLVTMSSMAFALTPSSIEGAFALVKTGDVKYISSVVLSKLPKAAVDLAPEGFVKYNALRIKNNHNNGIGGGVGGGRGHKC